MFPLGNEPFAQGRGLFADRIPGGSEGTAKVFVRIQFAGLPPQLAQLDTGAAYSVVDAETAQAVGFEPLGELTLSTRMGKVSGHLGRFLVRLVADEGESLDIEATFFVSSEWRGGLFLGYAGLLERLRFALDPRSNLFYFGAG